MSFYPKPGFNHRVTTIILCRGKEVEACMITILRLCSFCFHPPQAHLQRNNFTSLCIEEAKVKVFTNANLSHTNHCKTLYNSGILQVYFKLIQLGVTWSGSPTHLDGVSFFVFLVKPVSIKMSLLFWNQVVIKVYFPTSFSCTLVFLLLYVEVVCSYLELVVMCPLK